MPTPSGKLYYDEYGKPDYLRTGQQYADSFKGWYGTDLTEAQLIDYGKQGSSFPGAEKNVFQNLYQDSPVYSAEKPLYTQWTAAEPPEQKTSDPNWFWGIGPSGSEQERKLWEAVQYADPTAGLSDAVMAEIVKAFPGATKVSGDVVSIPDIGNVDILRNTQYGGAQPIQWWWGPVGPEDGVNGGEPGPQPAAALAAPAMPAVPAAPTPQIPTVSPTVAAGPNIRNPLIDQLLARMTQSLDVDARTSPVIRAQADPYAAAQEREARSFVADLAEKSGPYANLTGQSRLAGERAAQASGLFEAQLIGREIEARRSEIQSALTQLQGVLTTDEENALRRELANLGAELTKLGYDTQRYGIDVGAQTALSGQDLAWQQALLNNEQFLADLGLRAENQYNYWDALYSGLA